MFVFLLFSFSFLFKRVGCDDGSVTFCVSNTSLFMMDSFSVLCKTKAPFTTCIKMQCVSGYVAHVRKKNILIQGVSTHCDRYSIKPDLQV